VKLTDCTRQEAGECADALRRVLDREPFDEDGDPILSTFERFKLRDLLTALEETERRPVRAEMERRRGK
jgi:hypothetical protein